MKPIIAKFRNKKVLKAIVAVVLIGVIVGVFLFWQKKRDRVFIDNSQINAPLVTISSSGYGRLTELDAVEGKPVKKGDTIAIVGDETIRAITDGIIVMANNQVGGTVSPQVVLTQLINPADLRVAGAIDENKGLNKLKVGQVASFTVDAFPGQTFWGYVDEISPTAKQTQLSFSISSERPTQQFQVFVRFNSSKYPQIKNGMSAKITVFTGSI